jgi:hypothetical protein
MYVFVFGLPRATQLPNSRNQLMGNQMERPFQEVARVVGFSGLANDPREF